MKILVAIANYGTGNRQYLEQLIAEYRSMPWNIDLVVLSDIPKTLPGAVEVLVGLPDPTNPCSLPFAHRPLFAERRDEYDLFVYSEDDTLVRASNINAFLEATRVLRADEIAGFMRSEADNAGQMYVSSIHGFFRWLTSQVITRGSDTFAAFSNDHAACYMITRAQLALALDSGGFLVPPHNGRYDMLCAAATDVYTRCGFKRFVCISRVRDFILPHLPNKYIGRMGVPMAVLEAQVQALQRIAAGSGWRGPLVQTETDRPRGKWSKDLYEAPSDQLLEMIPAGTKRLLSVGCGWGATEAALSERGIDVIAVPIDPIMGDAVRRRGVRTVEGPLDDALSQLSEGHFDCILLADLLHLVDNPVAWLKRLRPFLNASTGRVVLSAPNTRDLTLRDAVAHARDVLGRPDEGTRVHATSPRRLRNWLRSAGFIPESIVPVLSGKRRMVADVTMGALESVLAQRFLMRGSVDTRTQEESPCAPQHLI